MGRTSPACRLSAPSTGCLLFDGLGGWEGPWLHRETALRTPVLCESAVCTPYCDVGLRFAPKGPYEIVAPSTLLSFCLRTSKAARVWGTVLYLTYTGKFKYPTFGQRGASHCPAMRVISTCGRPDAGQEKRDTTWRPRPQGTYLEPRISATAHMYTAPRKEHEYTICNMGLARSNRRRGIACCWSQGPIRHLRRYLHRATLRVAPG